MEGKTGISYEMNYDDIYVLKIYSLSVIVTIETLLAQLEDKYRNRNVINKLNIHKSTHIRAR